VLRDYIRIVFCMACVLVCSTPILLKLRRRDISFRAMLCPNLPGHAPNWDDVRNGYWSFLLRVPSRIIN
jgi:hypothetical protein